VVKFTAVAFMCWSALLSLPLFVYFLGLKLYENSMDAGYSAYNDSCVFILDLEASDAIV
jgi:hypothetical protein